MVVATAPAGQHSQSMVPRTRWRSAWQDPPHHHRRGGTQAANCTLALRDTGARPGGSRTEGLSLAGYHSHVLLRIRGSMLPIRRIQGWVEIADGRGCDMPSQRDGSHPTLSPMPSRMRDHGSGRW